MRTARRRERPRQPVHPCMAHVNRPLPPLGPLGPNKCAKPVFLPHCRGSVYPLAAQGHALPRTTVGGPAARVTSQDPIPTMSHSTGHKGNKQSLPSKPCVACGRPMSWRKKWEKNWEQVKYCSEACRRSGASR